MSVFLLKQIREQELFCSLKASNLLPRKPLAADFLKKVPSLSLNSTCKNTKNQSSALISKLTLIRFPFIVT